MAVEKSAVREGTRWDLRGRIVVVQEVTDRSVIYLDDHDFGVKVEKLEDFLARASDPVRAEHARLIRGVRYAQHDLPSEGETGKLLALLRDTAVYLLERMPPTCPPYVEPAPPAPKAEPAPMIVEAAPLPACEPVAEEISVADYDRIRSDFHALEDDYSARKKSRVR